MASALNRRSGADQADDNNHIDGTPEEESMRLEAEAAVREISFAVEFVEISKKFEASEQLVYLNLTTQEGGNYCVELSFQGFRIVSKQFDSIIDEEMSRYYETIYALLDYLSPKYRLSFGEALHKKLAALQREQTADDDNNCSSTVENCKS